MGTYYSEHLYFENRPESREYAIDKCMRVLGMIAMVKDRILRLKGQIDRMYGYSTVVKYKDKLNNDYAILSRLEQYYNYCIGKL